MPADIIALDRARITVLRDITFAAARPASERSRWPVWVRRTFPRRSMPETQVTVSD